VATLLFAERGAGKSWVALTLALSVARSERVLYLDGENGVPTVRERVDHALDSLGWEERPQGLTVRCDPILLSKMAGDGFGAAVADSYRLVIFDPWRTFLAQLGHNPDFEGDLAEWWQGFVAPLLRRGAAVVLLDNVGHTETGRPKGSATKLDAAPQALKVVTGEEYTPVKIGRLRIECTRSRYGDVGRTWTMRLGGDVLELPRAASESPAERRFREVSEKREQFWYAVVAALHDESPLGRDALIAAAKKHGVKGRTDTLREWVSQLAADPARGLSWTAERGYELAAANPDPDRLGQGGVTPPPATPDPPDPSLIGGQGVGSPDPDVRDGSGSPPTCDDPETCSVPTVQTAHGWHCERCDRYVPREPGRARQRRRERPL
jgi:AAA domain